MPRAKGNMYGFPELAARGSPRWALKRRIWNRVQSDGSMAGEAIVHSTAQKLRQRPTKIKITHSGTSPIRCEQDSVLLLSGKRMPRYPSE